MQIDQMAFFYLRFMHIDKSKNEKANLAFTCFKKMLMFVLKKIKKTMKTCQFYVLLAKYEA